MRPSLHWLRAFLLSFAVYLFPLIGPHAAFLLGQVIWRELTRGEREWLWVAADIALAVILQVIVFSVLYWLLPKRAIYRAIVAVIAVPLLAGAMEYAYMVGIPSFFLIEKDTAGEQGEWPVACVARGVSLIDIPHPERLKEWSEVPVQAPDGTYKLMRIPGCEVVPLPVPQAKVQPGGRVDFVTGLSYFVPGRGFIFSKQETATGAFTWNHLSADRITPIPGLHASASPILSLDGGWAAWLEKGSIAIEPLDGNEAPLQVILGALETYSYTLNSVDMQTEEIELRSTDRRIVVGFDGRIKAAERLPLIWDRYRDSGPYQLSWNINGNSGTHKVLKGRAISAAAITPSGDLIAVSVSTQLNIGRIRDSIYLLRARDGVEVFRRYLPTYTRSPVWFPNDDLFAYTADAQVLVLRRPR